MPEVPNCPYELGEAGFAWWAWAWETPQAAKWDAGVLYTAGRRALLEDEHAAVGTFDPDALNWFFSSLELGSEDAVQDAMRELGRVIGRLQALATGRVTLSREMRELEGQLGFGAKSMAALGWSGAPTPNPGADEEGDEVERARKRRAERIAGQSTAGAPTPS